jgi:hypothetical protein
MNDFGGIEQIVDEAMCRLATGSWGERGGERAISFAKK